MRARQAARRILIPKSKDTQPVEPNIGVTADKVRTIQSENGPAVSIRDLGHRANLSR